MAWTQCDGVGESLCNTSKLSLVGIIFMNKEDAFFWIYNDLI